MTEPATVLVVCTANRCRSPLAGAALRRAAATRGVTLIVETAGFGEPGLPATPPTVSAAACRGVDLAAHTSRSLDVDAVRRADLVVGMERAHVRDVVVLEPDAWPRAFTLKDLVRRGRAAGARGADEPLAAWLARVGEDRRRIDLLGVSADDDVADPTTDWRVDHETTAAELDELAVALVDLAWPAPGAG